MRIRLILLTVLCVASLSSLQAADKILVGPETEKRFPQLTIPDGFKATLFACDPLLEYPSVIAIGPRAGTLFVAHDYMTGLGVEIVRRDEVRLIEDSDDDGYADKSTVFAGDFNSIQGLAFYDGTVFVMHAPLLTSVRDTNGDGVADERKDMISGLGLPPEENSNRLHCANGVIAGHDGWLYLALGDRGCDVKRPEGDRLLFQQGGILRCRRDGSDFHVFSTGLRNIYDVALDAELNVFVRDNENDGGDYMIRVNHCFFGSDHGYPYHYYERPEEAMKPLADLGRGSSAGGTSYLETTFPEEYRDSLFFCEWGRAVVRYPKSRSSSSFEAMKEVDFAAGAATDPYGFKPTDLVVDRDGSLLISDWCDGQRPKRGRGRIYRVTAVDATPAKAVEQPALQRLNSDSYLERVAAQLELEAEGTSALQAVKDAIQSEQLNATARLHAVWIIAQSGAETAIDDLFEVAKSDPDPSVRAQAIRAIGDLTDPILVHDEIDAGRGDLHVAERVAKLAEEADPRVVLEALIVMGRIRWCPMALWIDEHLKASDPALDHAAQQSMRNVKHWGVVLRLVDGSPRVRKLALHALAEQRVEYLATRLIKRLKDSDDPQHRREYADALSRIVREEKPWTYWGFRPAPRPAASVDWKMTPLIAAALNDTLADDDLDVRSFVLQRMRREGVKPDLLKLAAWLSEESNEQRIVGILEAIQSGDATETRPILTGAILRSTLPAANRLAALSARIGVLKSEDETELIELTKQLEDGPVLAAVFREFGVRAKLDVNDLLIAKLASPTPTVRAESIRSLALRDCAAARDRVAKLLSDDHASVKQAAAEAAGLLKAVDTRDQLLELANSPDPPLVRACLISLRQLKDERAIDAAVAVLDDREAQVAALQYLRDFSSPTLASRVVQAAATNPSLVFQHEAIQTLLAWTDRFPDDGADLSDAVAKVHGQSGQPLAWGVSGPLTKAEVGRFEQWLTAPPKPEDRFKNFGGFPLVEFELSQAVGQISDGSVRIENPSGDEATWIAWSLVHVPVETNIEVLASASGSMTVSWREDRVHVHAREKPGTFRLDSDRFPAKLPAGLAAFFVKVTSRDKSPRFHLRFRRRSSKAEHERLVQYALQSQGNPSRGREVFQYVKKSSCLQCHRLGTEGGKIGPDLAGIGSRFSRIHLIESILEPSRTITPSYATLVFALSDGRVLTGVRVSEDEETLVVGDNQGKTHQISKADIDEISSQKISTMPEGLEKKLTDREFVDLLAFLESQKKGKEE